MAELVQRHPIVAGRNTFLENWLMPVRGGAGSTATVRVIQPAPVLGRTAQALQVLRSSLKLNVVFAPARVGDSAACAEESTRQHHRSSRRRSRFLARPLLSWVLVGLGTPFWYDLLENL